MKKYLYRESKTDYDTSGTWAYANERTAKYGRDVVFEEKEFDDLESAKEYARERYNHWKTAKICKGFMEFMVFADRDNENATMPFYLRTYGKQD